MKNPAWILYPALLLGPSLALASVQPEVPEISTGLLPLAMGIAIGVVMLFREITRHK